jgi:predicted DNA-binding transcriptional regulator AlpA
MFAVESEPHRYSGANMNETFLTELEVSRKTRISLATLRRWRLERRGPRFRKFGSLVRYGNDDLEEWMKAQPYGGDGTTRIEPKRMQLARETDQSAEKLQPSRAAKSRSSVDSTRRQARSLGPRNGV